jgi:hypothetical protein
VSHLSISSGVVRIAGIAFGWMAPTSVFGSQVCEKCDELQAKIDRNLQLLADIG